MKKNGIEQNVEYQSHLYASRNPLIGYIAWLRIKRILDKLNEGDSVLDAGCGEGYATSAFANKCKMVVGVDVVPERIKKANRIAMSNGVRDKTTFLCSDLFHLEHAIKDKFDVVVCSEVIEHVDEPEELLRILLKRVKRNGKLIITYPNEPVLQFGRKIFFLGKAKKIEDMTNHKVCLQKKNIEEFASKLGLKIVDCERIPNFPVAYLNELFVLDQT